MARLLVCLSVGFGVALASIVALIHTFATSWLTADVKVARLVISVTNQSMLAAFMCAVAVVIEGIAIASGEQLTSLDPLCLFHQNFFVLNT